MTNTLLTIKEVIKRFNIKDCELNLLIESGKIRTGILNTGEIVVYQDDIISVIPREELEENKQFSHLQGIEIAIVAASIKYSIPNGTISRWIGKGYIQVIRIDGRKRFINEADIAYCSYVYNRNPGQGKWLFTPSGSPYTPKKHTV